MSKYTDKAMALRNDANVHYNCAQAVLMAFSEKAGLSQAVACKLAANFGSGMKAGSVCGAVTGGLMALGIFGIEAPEDIKAYYSRVKAFAGESLDCAQLVHEASDKGVAKKVLCDGLIVACVEIVESILGEKGILCD